VISTCTERHVRQHKRERPDLVRQHQWVSPPRLTWGTRTPVFAVRGRGRGSRGRSRSEGNPRVQGSLATKKLIIPIVPHPPYVGEIFREIVLKSAGVNSRAPARSCGIVVLLVGWGSNGPRRLRAASAALFFWPSRRLPSRAGGRHLRLNSRHTAQAIAAAVPTAIRTTASTALIATPSHNVPSCA
jgi:hypothetical protein